MCQEPVENRSCHLENDRAISSPSRLALHLRRADRLLAEGVLPANQKREGEPCLSKMTRIIRGSEAESACDDIPAFCKACAIRNQSNKCTTMSVSKNMN